MSPKRVYDVAREAGLDFFWAWLYDGQVENIAFVRNGVHIDFDFLYEDGGEWRQLCFTKLDGVKYGDDRRWSVVSAPRPAVRGVRELHVPKYGFGVNVPVNADEYLTAEYGNWRVPDTNWRENNLGAVKLPGRKLMPLMGERVEESWFRSRE